MNSLTLDEITERLVNSLDSPLLDGLEGAERLSLPAIRAYPWGGLSTGEKAFLRICDLVDQASIEVAGIDQGLRNRVAAALRELADEIEVVS